MRLRSELAGPIRDGGACRQVAAPRAIIVSNRLPMTLTIDASGARLSRSSGGLATGLRGVHERSGGVWIGWAGADLTALEPSDRARMESAFADAGAVPVPLTPGEIAAFYDRYSNGGLWPALHEGLHPSLVTDADWESYVAVNRRYAEAVARYARAGDTVWVHDYHLMLVPRMVRERCPRTRIGYFLHTPFPSPDVFAGLRQAPALLDGLLGADVVGFHTREYARSFLSAVSRLRPHTTGADWALAGGRRVAVVARPMGIDVSGFARRAADAPVGAGAERLRQEADGPLFVGVDRLDYTKGIPERLLAFERLLDEEPGLRGRARLLQLAVPSREGAAGYPELRRRVQEIVERINARYGTPAHQPVRYEYRSVDDSALAVLYRAADVMLVTPLRDGMNLVAKEFVASRVDGDGVLVLSSRAGAAVELRSALLVEPDDIAGLAVAYRAALEMSPAERRVRMRRLRRAVSTNDVDDWAAEFLRALRVPGVRRFA